MQELAVLAARSMGMQKQFTAIADNVANANTHGYKRLDVSFHEVISRPKAHATASYVSDRGVRVDYADGTLEKTSNPLDLALNGKGFFAVQVNGQTQYTRRGQFVLDSTGTVVTPEGYPLLDNAGTPVQLPSDVQRISIARDGTISTETGQVGQVGMYAFSAQDEARMQRTGTANFAAPAGVNPTALEGATGGTAILQGMLENSNVNAVQEMVTMQTVSAAYQNSLRMMKSLEDSESEAIRSLKVN